MSYFKSNAKDFLSHLESRLDEGPGIENNAFKEVPLRLVELIQNGEEDIAENAVQLLGTAVGKDSELLLIIKCIPLLLT